MQGYTFYLPELGMGVIVQAESHDEAMKIFEAEALPALLERHASAQESGRCNCDICAAERAIARESMH